MNYKVLIVDDEPSALSALKCMIDWEKSGFRIAAEARNGREALAALAVERFSLVITDIRMPGINGLDLVKEIKRIANIPVLVMSGYEDFQYAKQALQYGVREYLLKPIGEEELISALCGVSRELKREGLLDKQLYHGIPAMRNDYLLYWAQGKMSMDELLSNADLLRLHHWRPEGATGMLIEYDFADAPDQDWTEKELETKWFAVKNIVQEMLEDFGYSFDWSTDILGVVFFEEHPLEFAERLQSFIRQFAKTTVTVGVGKRAARSSQAPQSFAEAKAALDKKFLLGKDRLLTLEQFEIGTDGMEGEWLFPGTEAIVSGIRCCDREQVLDELNRIWTQLRQEGVGENTFKFFVFELLTNLYEIVRDKGGDYSSIFSPDNGDYRQVTKARILDDLYRYVHHKCIETVHWLQNQRVPQIRLVIEQVKKIVAEQYGNNSLTLKSISQQLYLNPTYLGKLFKTDTSLTFNDYLLSVRMEKAKELLHTTHMKIYEVSEAVGYRDIDWFYKKFRAYTGVSAMEYKESTGLL